MSAALTVQLPAVLFVRARTFVPDNRATLAGRRSLGSVPLTPTVSLTLGTVFQFASTALTVTL